MAYIIWIGHFVVWKMECCISQDRMVLFVSLMLLSMDLLVRVCIKLINAILRTKIECLSVVLAYKERILWINRHSKNGIFHSSSHLYCSLLIVYFLQFGFHLVDFSLLT